MITQNKKKHNENIIIDLTKKKINFTFDKKGNFNLYLYNCCKKNHMCEINIYLKNIVIVNIYCLILAYLKTEKIILNIYHCKKKSQSFVKTKLFAAKNANIIFNCFSKNKKNITKSILEQNIDGFVLDDTAQINVIPSLTTQTNNSNAKHTVNLGKINQKILFYLNSKTIKNSQIHKLYLLNFFMQSNFLIIFKEKKIIETIENFFKITNSGYEY